MNGPGNVKINFNIKFNGKTYKSVEEMPPEERALFEQARARLAQQNPGQDYDQVIADSLKQAQALLDGMAGTDALPKAWDSKDGTPVVPKGFESVTNLGEAVKSYLARKNDLRTNLVFGIVLFTIGAGLGLFAIAILSSPWSGSSTGFILGLGIPGAIFLLVGILLLIDPIRQRLNSQAVINALVIYRDGFAYRTPGQVHVLPWRSIANIYSDETFHATSGGIGYTDERYLFALKNGEPVTLTGEQFLEIDLIITQIKQAVSAELLPTLQSAYQNGSILAFGPVKVSQNAGIEANGRQFAWNMVYIVSVKQGRLKIVTKDEKTFNVRAKLIPNIEMLCQLIGVDPYEIDLSYI